MEACLTHNQEEAWFESRIWVQFLIKVNKMSFQFQVDDESAENARKFREKHDDLHKGKYLGAIGGAYSFIFTRTSIGELQTIKCFCGESELINMNDI